MIKQMLKNSTYVLASIISTGICLRFLQDKYKEHNTTLLGLIVLLSVFFSAWFNFHATISTVGKNLEDEDIVFKNNFFVFIIWFSMSLLISWVLNKI